MKIAVVCKSDSTGGAAIVSRRLTEALREQGEDATMLVLEKLSDFPYVIKASYPLLKPLSFLAERLQIFFHNHFSKKNLFKADTGNFGLPLWRHSIIKEADAVILNWVNQGMLSLKGIKKIAAYGQNNPHSANHKPHIKPIIWIMHDQWNMTGVCHHSLLCRRFEAHCGDCPILESTSQTDLSTKIQKRKKLFYETTDIQFIAVSNWLASEARKSSLMQDMKVSVIPNPFRPISLPQSMIRKKNIAKTILFAAASLDNYMKGLDTFRDAVNLLADKYDFEVLLMGAAKNPASLGGFRMKPSYVGSVVGDEALAEIYSRADILVNSSAFENLPGTLVEAQAYGAIPVTFNRGGQRDIIEHLHTGYLAPWSESPSQRALNIATGIVWALAQSPEEIRQRMKQSVEEKFSYHIVTQRYLNLLKKIKDRS